MFPFNAMEDLSPGSNVTAALRVYGLYGGMNALPRIVYSHLYPLLQHPSFVKPNENIAIRVKVREEDPLLLQEIRL